MQQNTTSGGLLAESPLADAYQPPPGVYDELASPHGVIRPHWARFLGRLATLGPDRINHRWDIAARLIREDDVFDPAGQRRLNEFWSLDLMPYLLTPQDWEVIESAVIQRATLINHVLKDIYGQQLLIRDGVIPADLVFAHPGFLRPCHGMTPPQGKFLHFYAADIARGPDGSWTVLADRTQAPSGAGYALENRVVITRTFPEIFRNFQVRRLIGFFQAVRDALLAATPAGIATPNVVILSPGTSHPTHFEHVHLARFLGFPMVEPGDLTTRDSHVYVKTLNGLRRVDVVMRHVNDSLCDPLELRYDSLLGVPGLVQAARAGNVSVVNGLGSGMVGTYAFRAFMDDCCRAILGESLKLPSLETWWCGIEEHLEYVKEHFSELVIKGAFRVMEGDPVYCGQLDAAGRRALLDKIRIRPEEYVAQRLLPLSCAPTWSGSRLEARQFILRVYAVATADGYSVMPGGVGRIPPPRTNEIVSFNTGGGSKDVWVLSDTPVDPRVVLSPVATAAVLSRTATALPSRVADNLFWFGRYAERTESQVRLLRAVLSRITSIGEERGIPELPVLMRNLHAAGLILTEPDGDILSGDGDLREAELLDAVFSRLNPASVISNINELRRISWLVRDRLSSDTWRLVNRLEEDLAPPDNHDMPQLTDVYTLLNQVVLTLSAFSGLVMESMTRGPGWMFLDIGRRLERALSLISLLRVSLVTAGEADPAILESVLEIADSVMTYRSRYLSSHQLDGALDLLLLDDSNPRSVMFQLGAIAEHVNQLPAPASNGGGVVPKEQAVALMEELRALDPAALVQSSDEGIREGLDRHLQMLEDALPALSDLLTRTYFSHTEVRQLGAAPGALP